MAGRVSVGRFTGDWRWGAGGFAGCAAVLGVGYALNTQTVTPAPQVAPDKVFLAGVPVAGKSPEEVEKLAVELSSRLKGYPLAIRYQKRSQWSTAGLLGASVDVKGAVGTIFDPNGRKVTVIQRAWEVFTGPARQDVPLPVRVDEAKVAERLLRFSIKIGAEPRSARLTKLDGKFKATPPKPGKELDGSAVGRSIEEALNEGELRTRLAASLEKEAARKEWLAGQKPIEIAAALREAEPHVTLEKLKPITDRLVTFSTGLGGSSRNRVHNIQLACRAIDGTVLLPGDVFSYNETVGPRVPSAGFREAPVIIQGRLQPGTGGGICQVSSTLYNAVLLADLAVVRRSHHAFPVHYLPAGRDATVVDGAIDFRFKNTFKHPVAIDAKVDGRKVVFNIYGHPEDRREVEIQTSGFGRIGAGVRTVSDSRLGAGRRVVEKRAMDGRRVTVTRIVKKEGQVVRQEVISRDYYRPIPGVVRIGTRSPDRSTAVLGSRPAVGPVPSSPEPAKPASPTASPEQDAGGA